jgi:hypothetical protein
MADEKKEAPKLKFKGPWRVVAMQQGQYNQFMMEIGMVFDLLTYQDGTYPIAKRYVLKKDDNGAPLLGWDDKERFIAENWDHVPVIGKDGVVVHRDFALDLGTKPVKSGRMKGEVMRVGWMKRVPDRTPLGQYEVDPDTGLCKANFWEPRVQLPQAFDVGYHPWQPGPGDRKRNHAAILAFYPDPEPEAEEYQDEEAVA